MENKVAFQGEIGAFSEQATLVFSPQATPVPYTSFESVFNALCSGAVDSAVIPIENSLFGSVHINYDLLKAKPVKIIAELNLRIHHNLMAIPGHAIEEIRTVYSHPQALGQCATFLKKRLPDADLVADYDTAGAAKRISEKRERGAAAIASEAASRHYGLNILANRIESNHKNYTRFLLLVREHDAPPVLPSDLLKTSVVYTLRKNVPGALFKSLAVFALREIDLFKIESRPLVGSPGQYLFYLDLQALWVMNR